MCIRSLLIVVAAFVITADCASLNLSLTVPSAVRRSDTVTLGCEYALTDTTLYQIKWYKDALEFFRYIPKETPPGKQFYVSGVNLDIDKSNSYKIVLSNVQPNATGMYSCEVSLDAPSFHTTMQKAFMQVVDFVEEAPTVAISTRPSKILATCTSPPSDPPFNITWVVNNEKIYGGKDTHIPAPTHVSGNQLRITRSEIVLDRNIYKYKANIRCVATLFNLYQKEVEYVGYNPLILERKVTPYLGTKRPNVIEINFVIYFVVVIIIMGVLYGYVWYKS